MLRDFELWRPALFCVVISIDHTANSAYIVAIANPYIVVLCLNSSPLKELITFCQFSYCWYCALIQEQIWQVFRYSVIRKMLAFEKNVIESFIRKYVECIQLNELIIARAVSSRKLQAARWKFATVMTHSGASEQINFEKCFWLFKMCKRQGIIIPWRLNIFWRTAFSLPVACKWSERVVLIRRQQIYIEYFWKYWN